MKCTVLNGRAPFPLETAHHHERNEYTMGFIDKLFGKNAMGKLPIGISPAIRMIQAASQAGIQVHKYRNQNGKDEKRLPAKCIVAAIFTTLPSLAASPIPTNQAVPF